MNRPLHIIPIPRDEPDLKLLAQALIALVEELRAKEEEAKAPKQKEQHRA